jgi:lysophospholipase L1-like esterase
MLPFLLIVALVGGGLIALIAQTRWLRARRLAQGLLISYVTLLLLVGIGEFYFRFIYADSENTISLATQNWLDRHWHINALGFRDREWTAADFTDKTVIAVTGDSFAAGWGIQNPADRFSNVLAAQLGDDYAIVNLGVYGTSTPEQLNILQAFTLATPDVVILQYFLNDIDYAGLSLGLLPEPKPMPVWAKESYLANFLYIRLLSRWLDPQFNADWWEWNYAAYDNLALWSVHRAEIEAYINYVESIHARLIVVIFPNMLDPVRSVAYVDRVAHVFEERGHTEILKLFDAAAAWSLTERIVSPRDTHPSVAFHRYVGEMLYAQFFAGEGS